ncbi:MAG TPA: M48 family metalloprotease [Candidatus Angelobacter sp.]|nr:M48 family metalloprotease [Candidatus Angelobacter sp.]
MFVTLAVALALAVLFLLACSGFLLALPGWWLLRHSNLSLPARRRASLLFALRMAPLLLAAVFTVGFVLPAFVRFEPRSTTEDLNPGLLGLAACGLIVVTMISVRFVRMAAATRRLRRHWLGSARRLHHVEGITLPVYSVDAPSGLLAVTGIFRPQIFVARRFVESLSPQELEAALAHEVAHVSAFDNLRQALLRITRPPFWRGDTAWTSASEIAADEAALLSGASVLDLSAALVKAGRLGGHPALNGNAAVSCLLPSSSRADSSVHARVRHLELLLSGTAALPAPGQPRRFLPLLALLLGLGIYAACFQVLLPWVHDALEFLVH